MAKKGIRENSVSSHKNRGSFARRLQALPPVLACLPAHRMASHMADPNGSRWEGSAANNVTKLLLFLLPRPLFW